MLMASGLNFGMRRTVPHLLGVSIGFAAMVFAVGFGIAGVFKTWPALYTTLKIVSIIYLLWLAWRIAMAGEVNADGGAGRPFTFIEAAAFQWVNPKAWIMAVGISATYLVAGAVLDQPWRGHAGLPDRGAVLVLDLGAGRDRHPAADFEPVPGARDKHGARRAAGRLAVAYRQRTRARCGVAYRRFRAQGRTIGVARKRTFSLASDGFIGYPSVPICNIQPVISGEGNADACLLRS